MKTTITTLLLLITLISKSQNYVKLPIWELEKDTVTIGDSLYIGFKIVPPSVSTNTTASFQIQLPNFDYLWTGNYNTLYSLPTYTFNNGATHTLYKKYLTIPLNATLGDNKIYSSGGYNVSIFIKPQVVNSVNELSKNNIVSIKYYDIYGTEKAPNNESLYIKITTYSNGYLKKEKIIIQ